MGELFEGYLQAGGLPQAIRPETGASRLAQSEKAEQFHAGGRRSGLKPNRLETRMNTNTQQSRAWQVKGSR